MIPNATRADLLRRLDRRPEAARAYREALDLATTDAERRYLARRLAETRSG
jgi:RNA polymerase sigma-70 factor (ECF subfamily)